MPAILYPLTTEKAVAAIERENRLTFIVEASADKKKIKEEFEKIYAEKVYAVNTAADAKGNKKAYIRLKRKGGASDVAAKLKIL